MVKVFPGNFSFFEKQDILTPDSGEPFAITCSDEFLFVAEEGCLLEVYDLATLQLVARFRTVSPVVDFVYNAKGDCIVTVESKSPGSHGFARIYFKWRGSSVDKPMRVSLLESLSRGLMQSAATQDRIAAEIVELPAEYNSSVTCLACCKESGRIAVGMDSTIRVFSLCPELEEEEEGAPVSLMDSPQHSRLRKSPTKGKVLSHSIEILLDIKTSIPLSKISIFNDYIAFISPFEARVLKLSFLADPSPPTATLREQPFSALRKEVSTNHLTSSDDDVSPRVTRRSRRNDAQSNSVKMDPNFVLWSPSKVWEVEKFSASYTMSLSGNGANSPFLNVLPHRPTFGRSHTTSHDPRRSPVVGTISLQSVGQSTSSKTSDQHKLEVLGPSEYVWGQPIDVSIEESISEKPSIPPRCRVLTMLYRRFAPMISTLSETESLRTRSLTLPSRHASQQQQWSSIGLHSVQLLPTIVSDASGTPQLAGISCFIANRFHGYLYDVHVKTRLVSSFSFMSKMETIVADCSFLHALSGDSVETYTNRSFQATVWSQGGGSGKKDADDEEEEDEEEEDVVPEHAQWMKQPCPPPNMDLTLVAASKFVGSCRLATSKDYVIVLTKSVDPSSSQPGGSKWLLQSLSIRRAPSEPTWNVYILKKKDPMSLYQHFVEYANSLKANSPPMYQHVLSESHALLRSQLVQNGSLSPTMVTDMVQTLRENCHSLANSLCTYSTDTPNTAALNGARYFMLSGAHISDVVQHVTTTYTKDSAKAYSVLMSYLNLILFDHGDHTIPDHVTGSSTGGGVSRQLLSPLLADSLVEIYAEHRPEQLTNFLLHSWVKNYSPEKALGLLNRSSQSPRQLQKIQLCQALLLLRINSTERLREKLVQLPEEFLTNWLKKNLQFAVDSSSARLTEFGKVLQLHKENCLLDVLSHCLSTNYLNFQLLCQLLQAGSTSQEELADNVVLKQFLDRIILDRIPVKGGLGPDEKQRAMILLVDVLMARLSSSHSPRPSTATPFSLYGSRHKWLDNLPPFDGSVSKASQSLLQDLMQLQALLCRSEGVEVAGHLERVMEESGLKMEGGALSLQLLSFPHTNKMKQAIQLILQYAPTLTVEYCLTYLPPQLDHWRDLLATLLDICTSHDQQSSSANPQLVETHRSLYKAALNHVLTVTTPEEFMALLPPSGSINFYLPFIEHSCKLYLSRQVAEQLHSTSYS